MHSKDEPLFRVGGIYRNRDGKLVKLFDRSFFGFRGSSEDCVYANEINERGEVINGQGVVNLTNGYSSSDSNFDLMLGERDEQGNLLYPDSDGLSDALSEQAKHLKGEAPAAPQWIGIDYATDPSIQRDEKGAEAVAAWHDKQQAQAARIAAQAAAARVPTGKAGDPHPAINGLLRVR